MEIDRQTDRDRACVHKCEKTREQEAREEERA